MSTYMRDFRHETFHLFTFKAKFSCRVSLIILLIRKIILNIFKDLILLLYINYCTVGRAAAGSVQCSPVKARAP